MSAPCIGGFTLQQFVAAQYECPRTLTFDLGV